MNDLVVYGCAAGGLIVGLLVGYHLGRQEIIDWFDSATLERFNRENKTGFDR